ncbi:hypothetical protein FNW02_37365 [Komarekiella sp. 'clone 1']|uniref:Uncharacterized protein n=1 Tax=Komarekiella delphini-convector SJRDD-AB1 TaxID=2593771 RepID=A0AA41BAI6_9NOST|nr:hypothetical protein [Komarekiella delphini-convector]MBD6621218.1 hypothetical protein [Komarekiella delphini-convector SJRDD-AB1]
MPRKFNSCSEITAINLLDSLRVRGGSAPLHSISFPQTSIQYLLDKQLVRVKNTGCGFLVEIIKQIIKHQ